MRWYPLAAITAALVLAGCSSSTPTDPTPDTRGAVLGPQVGDPSGMVQSALGAWTLQVDPTSATAILELVRTGAATLYGQGQNYLLSVRPFFNPGDVSVRRVSVDPDGRLRVSVRVQHPFDVPADPTRPATATKRLDLHIAEAHLLLVADGSDTFFSGTPDGPVVVNHGLLSNAEGYRDPGPLFDPVAMGVASATAFPYRMLGDFDPVDPDGNYNPTGGGWQGAALLAPTGYGVFPMGADKTVDLVLNLQTGDTLDLGLVVLAKYQDPRGGTTAVQKRANRLPDPTEPTALRYHMPQGAGDLERITLSPPPTMEDLPTGATTLTGTVLDWDHAATVIAPTAWPDSSDLSKIPEDSSPDAAEASVPALDSDGVFAGTLVPSGPTAVTVDVSVALDNRDAFDVPSGTAVVPGLLRVTDAQDNDDTAADGVINQVLSEESTIPLPGMHPLVPTVRYQAFAVTVEDATACTPTTFAFQTQEVAVNADPAQNFRTVSWDSFDLKKIAAADQTGDVYLFYRWSSSPNTWFVSRTANGGDSWGVPAAIPSSLLGGTYTTGTTLTMGASVLLTGPTSGQPIVIANANLTAPNPVFFLKGVDGAGGTTTWSGNDGSTITPSGTYRVATITGDPTDLTGQRAYALVRQTGAGVNQLHLFRTINAQAMVPTWTNLGPVDDNGGSGSEDEPVMVIDLSGNLHVVYRHAPIIGTNDVWYRKISTPGTTPSLGPVVMVSNSGTENVNNLQLFADATGRALVVWEQWDNNDSSFGDIFIARGDAAGTSFTTPLQVDPAGTDQSYPDVIVDTTGRVVVAWNDGTLTARSVFLAAYSADLSCQLVPPTRAHTDVPSSTVDFPRLALDIVRNRLLVIYRRNGFGGPLPSPDSGYQLRSRWFTIM